MALRLPVGARNVLANDANFLKRDMPVVDRLRNSTDGYYISALQKVDDIIREHNPTRPYLNESDQITEEFIFDDSYSQQWMIFFDYLVFCSSVYSKEKADEIRNGRKDFAAKMEEISATANKLSTLMQATELVGNIYGFSADADAHPLGLLESTVANQTCAETRCRYNGWVADTIRQARSFDLKYFPSITALLDEISRQYSQEFGVTEVAKVANSTSKVNDFCMQFFGDLNHAIDINHFSSRLLENRVITYSDWASIFGASLPSEFNITSNDIKNFRRKNRNGVNFD